MLNISGVRRTEKGFTLSPSPAARQTHLAPDESALQWVYPLKCMAAVEAKNHRCQPRRRPLQKRSFA
jgi:hypothetical protein